MRKVFETLYKVNSRGKTQIWEIVAEQLGNGYGIYTMTYGQAHGAKISSSVIISEGKNIGKANETSIWEQTVFEALSKWKKQLDKGYREARVFIGTQPFVTADTKKYLPMLAKSFKDAGHKIEYPAYVQPKLDGMRCVAFKEGSNITLLSRKGKDIKVLDHIKKALVPIFITNPDLILDGELFTRSQNFQKLIGAIKRDSANDDTAGIEYWVYDHFSNDDFSARNEFLDKALYDLCHPSIVYVPTKLVQTEQDVISFHKYYVDNKYEGCMVRNARGGYQNDKRSDNLQKVKSFMDEEFEVVDAEENKGSQAGQCTFICVNKDGKRFGVKPMGDATTRAKYWQNAHNYYGKMLTVRFFEYSDDGIPRFPIGVMFRDYE